MYKSYLIDFHNWKGFSTEGDLIDRIIVIGFVTLVLSKASLVDRLLRKAGL
jgi:CO dehydrogenase/acetyl-CoA synthase epsilon subunit